MACTAQPRRSLPAHHEAHTLNAKPLDLLACPLCRGPLSLADDGLRCPADGAAFPRHPSGLMDLRPPGVRAAAEAFAAGYRAERLAEGWQPLTPEAARALPYTDPPGFTRLYWAVRRESLAALTALLAEACRSAGQGPQPALTIADAGAGFPWLSHRLAASGHRVIAFDLSADRDFGIAAARLYPSMGGWGPEGLPPGQFLPLLGDLQHPPLAAGRYDVVICNASLHYVEDLDAAVRQLARALGPAGALIILDSPIAGRGRPGNRPGSRILGREEVEQALARSNLLVAWRFPRRGWLWRRHQLKNWLLRRASFEFPLVVGCRRGEQRQGGDWELGIGD